MIEIKAYKCEYCDEMSSDRRYIYEHECHHEKLDRELEKYKGKWYKYSTPNYGTTFYQPVSIDHWGIGTNLHRDEGCT